MSGSEREKGKIEILKDGRNTPSRLDMPFVVAGTRATSPTATARTRRFNSMARTRRREP
jgi:hypothetical protein